jgi:DNA-binding NarL/FixJ family response regulator
MAPVQVLAVDDQPIFLRTLRQLVAAAPGFELAGDAQSGAEALDRAAQLRPDLVLLDVRMPDMDGVETARRLLAADAEATVVLISLDPLPDREAVLDLGVAGFVRKQELSVRRLQEAWEARHGNADTTQRA